MSQLSFTFVERPAPTGSYRADLELLHLDPSRPPTSTEVRAAYHALALTTHPDVTGGDRTRFSAITEAYKRLKTDAMAREQLCVVCGGRGTVELKTRGFMPARIECSTCEGSGQKIL